MLVGLVGDLEGELDAARRWLQVLGERGDVEVAYQLGDLRFGMGTEPEAYLAAIESVCAQYELRLFCINGNHENWAELDRLWSSPPSYDQNGRLSPDRGHRTRQVAAAWVPMESRRTFLRRSRRSAIHQPTPAH